MNTRNSLLTALLLFILGAPLPSHACIAGIESRFEYSRNVVEPPANAISRIQDALERARGLATAPDHYSVLLGITASNEEVPDLSARQSLVLLREKRLISLLLSLGVPSAKIGLPASESDSSFTRKAISASAVVIVSYGCPGA